MSDSNDAPTKKPSALRDMSGTTVALTSLAVMAAAAVVSAPVWFWYRRKRKRTDVFVSQPPGDVLPVSPADASSPDAVSEDVPTPGPGEPQAH